MTIATRALRRPARLNLWLSFRFLCCVHMPRLIAHDEPGHDIVAASSPRVLNGPRGNPYCGQGPGQEFTLIVQATGS